MRKLVFFSEHLGQREYTHVGSLEKFSRQVSKLDQLVTIQCMPKNNHESSVMLETSLILDGRRQTAMCHSSVDPLLHHMDVKTESQSICGDMLHSKC
jgi:hypothetical protein